MRPLGEVLGPMRRQWRRTAREREALSLPEILPAVLGPARAAPVGCGGIARGMLTLRVDSAALKAELESFGGDALLRAFQATPEGARLRGLRFEMSGGAGG